MREPWLGSVICVHHLIPELGLYLLDVVREMTYPQPRRDLYPTVSRSIPSYYLVSRTSSQNPGEYGG